MCPLDTCRRKAETQSYQSHRSKGACFANVKQDIGIPHSRGCRWALSLCYKIGCVCFHGSSGPKRCHLLDGLYLLACLPTHCLCGLPVHVLSGTPPHPPLPSFRRAGERCHPRGPASSEVTRAQQAHWELRSLECSWGREVLSTPQDLPSTGMLPAGLALCATLPVTLWVSQGAPQTTCPVHPSGVQSWAAGSCRSPDPQTPSAATW